MTRPVVVSDSGPLIALAGCGLLMLLSDVFDAIHVPLVVLDETTADRSRPGAVAVAAFVRERATVYPNRKDTVYLAAVKHLDEGEAQALSLAHELQCGVLIDERRGRQAALRQNLPVFGTLGVLLRAKEIGKIDAVAPALGQIQSNGYRISSALVEEVLALARES